MGSHLSVLDASGPEGSRKRNFPGSIQWPRSAPAATGPDDGHTKAITRWHEAAVSVSTIFGYVSCVTCPCTMDLLET